MSHTSLKQILFRKECSDTCSLRFDLCRHQLSSVGHICLSADASVIFSKRTGEETEEDTDSLTDKLQGSAVVLIDHLDLLLAMDDTRMFYFDMIPIPF